MKTKLLTIVLLGVALVTVAQPKAEAQFMYGSPVVVWPPGTGNGAGPASTECNMIYWMVIQSGYAYLFDWTAFWNTCGG